jgi:hypothetical protein
MDISVRQARKSLPIENARRTYRSPFLAEAIGQWLSIAALSLNALRDQKQNAEHPEEDRRSRIEDRG